MAGVYRLPEIIYQIEYDGASSGNPGPGGAGALLRHPYGDTIEEVSVGLGTTTSNVAEYRGLITGLKAALDNGLACVHIQGDSNLVTEQIYGVQRVLDPRLQILHGEAMALLSQFQYYNIRCVHRNCNSAADALAKRGVQLFPGETSVSGNRFR